MSRIKDTILVADETLRCPFCEGELYLIDCHKNEFLATNDYCAMDVFYFLLGDDEFIKNCYRTFDSQFNCSRPCFYFCTKRKIINLEGDCFSYIIEGLNEAFLRKEGFSVLLHQGFVF